MISFACDYLEGCHEKILEALIKTNREQLAGYGSDRYTESAKRKIKEACECPGADVWFLNGGTATNRIVIDSMLQPYEGVLAAESGHINVHEAGAIETGGHKVIALPEHEGKIDAGELEAWTEDFYRDENHEHMVFPGMVYLSWPTEYGTLYSEDELKEIYSICKKYGIVLYIDGARMGYGLASDDTTLTLPKLSKLCDVFYIGGTKVGALCGEALVFPNGNAPAHFLTRIKQHGALAAKGRLVGISFDTLFTDDLYLTISKNAIDRAEEMKAIFHEKQIPFYLESPTNQQFFLLENAMVKHLSESVGFDFWSAPDENHTVVRFVTSWATTKEQVEALREILPDMG